MTKNASRPAGRHFLQIPGPTPIPDRILRAMDAPIPDVAPVISAPIVREHSEFPRHFRRYLIGGISHGLGRPGVLQMTARGKGYNVALV